MAAREIVRICDPKINSLTLWALFYHCLVPIFGRENVVKSGERPLSRSAPASAQIATLPKPGNGGNSIRAQNGRNDDLNAFACI